MVTYPITVARVGYRGIDPKKRMKATRENQVAAEIEKAVNDQLLKQKPPVQSYTYHEISSITGYAVEEVRQICFSIDGGHNGFTAIRSGLSYEEAMKSIHDEGR